MQPSEGKRRLFVGQVPATAKEEDLRPIFAPYGEITEIFLLRKDAGEHRGCAFVTYRDAESADAAIAATHNTHTLHGASRPIQVSHAQTQGTRNAFGATTPVTNENTPTLDPMIAQSIAEAADAKNRYSHRVTLSGVPNTWRLEQVKDVFNNLGEVLDVCMHLKKDAFDSTGSATIMLATAEQATEACNHITSKVAKSELASTIKATLVKRNEDLPSNGKIFVGQIPDTFTEDDLKNIFGHFGTIEDLNVLRDRQDPQQKSKGCAFMKFVDPSGPLATICLIHGKFQCKV